MASVKNPVVPHPAYTRNSSQCVMILSMPDELDRLAEICLDELHLNQSDYFLVVEQAVDAVNMEPKDLDAAIAELPDIHRMSGLVLSKPELLLLRDAAQRFAKQYYRHVLDLGLPVVEFAGADRATLPYFFDHLCGPDIYLKGVPY